MNEQSTGVDPPTSGRPTGVGVGRVGPGDPGLLSPAGHGGVLDLDVDVVSADFAVEEVVARG